MSTISDRAAQAERTPCAKHDLAGSAIGWQSWCPGCNPELHRPAGAEPVVDPIRWDEDPAEHAKRWADRVQREVTDALLDAALRRV